MSVVLSDEKCQQRLEEAEQGSGQIRDAGHSHNRRVPIRKVFDLSSGPSMSKKLDRKQIHLVGKLLVCKLATVKVRRGGEGVHKDKRRFGTVVGIRHLVSSLDATKVIHMDCFGV